jgi:hypothetical protein
MACDSANPRATPSIDANARSLHVADFEPAAHKSREIALIQAQAARYTDTVALFQALGGGWQSGPL